MRGLSLHVGFVLLPSLCWKPSEAPRGRQAMAAVPLSKSALGRQTHMALGVILLNSRLPLWQGLEEAGNGRCRPQCQATPVSNQ